MSVSADTSLETRVAALESSIQGIAVLPFAVAQDVGQTAKDAAVAQSLAILQRLRAACEDPLVKAVILNNFASAVRKQLSSNGSTTTNPRQAASPEGDEAAQQGDQETPYNHADVVAALEEAAALEGGLAKAQPTTLINLSSAYTAVERFHEGSAVANRAIQMLKKGRIRDAEKANRLLQAAYHNLGMALEGRDDTAVFAEKAFREVVLRVGESDNHNVSAGRPPSSSSRPNTPASQSSNPNHSHHEGGAKRASPCVRSAQQALAKIANKESQASENSQTKWAREVQPQIQRTLQNQSTSNTSKTSASPHGEPGNRGTQPQQARPAQPKLLAIQHRPHAATPEPTSSTPTTELPPVAPKRSASSLQGATPKQTRSYYSTYCGNDPNSTAANDSSMSHYASAGEEERMDAAASGEQQPQHQRRNNKKQQQEKKESKQQKAGPQFSAPGQLRSDIRAAYTTADIRRFHTLPPLLTPASFDDRFEQSAARNHNHHRDRSASPNNQLQELSSHTHSRSPLPSYEEMEWRDQPDWNADPVLQPHALSHRQRQPGEQDWSLIRHVAQRYIPRALVPLVEDIRYKEATRRRVIEMEWRKRFEVLRRARRTATIGALEDTERVELEIEETRVRRVLKQWITGKALFVAASLRLDAQESQERSAIGKATQAAAWSLGQSAVLLHSQAHEESKRVALQVSEWEARAQLAVELEVAQASLTSTSVVRNQVQSISYALALWCVEQHVEPDTIQRIEDPKRANSLAVLERYAVFGRPRKSQRKSVAEPSAGTVSPSS